MAQAKPECISIETQTFELPTLNKPQRFALALTIVLFCITWIAPLWPVEHALHSSGTVIGLIWLVWHQRRWPMCTWDFIAICIFIAVHCIAARWLYSNMPYDRWLMDAFGWSPQVGFGWERNHTDRLIHFLYGLCFMPALQWHTQQRWPLRARQAFAMSVALIMTTSLVYEWFEWAIALALSPEAAEAYNGQQGDMWDAHMDMLLATLGALSTWPWLARRARKDDTSMSATNSLATNTSEHAR
jgi:putative membrane protein